MSVKDKTDSINKNIIYHIIEFNIGLIKITH